MNTHPAPQIVQDPELRVIHNQDKSRYELWKAQQFIGFLGVEVLEDGTVDLQHTIIDEKFGRQGYARTLVTLVLDQFRTAGLEVHPTCSYIWDFMNRFPQYRDLLAAHPHTR